MRLIQRGFQSLTENSLLSVSDRWR